MKNLLKLTFILSIVITFHLNSFGQHQFGVKVSGGISRIYGSLGADKFNSFPSSIPPASSSFSPCIQAGFYYLLPTGKNTSIGTELLYSKIQGSQTETWEKNSVNTVGYTSKFTNEYISFLSLPVYFGVTVKRLTINAGLQLSYVLSSSGSVETTSSQTTIINNDPDNINPRALYASNGNYDLKNLAIKEVDFGPRAGFVYQLSNKLSLDGSFYYGLNNINLRPSTEKELKIQQLTLGIRYALGSKQAVIPTKLEGQKQFGIKAGYGLSKTNNPLDQIGFSNPFGYTNQYYYTTPFLSSGQGGVYYNVQFGKHSYLGAELLFSQVEGNERMTQNYMGKILNVNGDSVSIEIGPFQDDIHFEYNHLRHVSYLSFPFYYGYKINKWSINAGLQFNYALLIRERYQRNITVNGEPYNTFDKKLDVSMVSLDIGPRAGVIYQLSRQLAVEANYYYGLNDLRKRELYGNNSELKVQQMTVGVRYALWSN